MSTTNPGTRRPEEKAAPAAAAAKKAYQKPAFCHERIFETMALQCGKFSTTQSNCKHSVKNS